MFFFCRPAAAPLRSGPGGGQGNLATLAVAQDCMFCLLFFVVHVTLFSLWYAFPAKHSPPLAGLQLWVVPHFHFVLGFRLFVSSPRHADRTREGLTVVCLAIAPLSEVCLAIGSFSGVCLTTAPCSSRPPATLAVRGRFLTGGFLYD